MIENNEKALIEPIKVILFSIYDLYNDKKLMESIVNEKK